MRYENKFVFDSTQYSSIINMIMSSSAIFREIYYQRKVNNIYLDSAEYSDYYANITGEQSRTKHRIRWYSDTMSIQEPVLEYKIKFGELGTKQFYSLPSFLLDDDFAYSDYLSQIRTHAYAQDDSYINMYHDISALRPTLFNTYQRRYFASGDDKYRITIDTNMTFNSIGETYRSSFGFGIDDIVMELKYDNVDRVGANRIMDEFSTRLSRNSKYVNGISGLYFNHSL